MQLLRLTPLLAVLIFIHSCSGKDASAPDLPPAGTAVHPGNALELPAKLPVDGLQPWEGLDGNGHVVDPARRASSINASTDFTPGIQRFLESGDVAANGDASRLNGAEDSGTSYAMYRVRLQDRQPGIVSIDANLLGSSSEYFVGISDYGNTRWDWHGPFSDSHVRLQALRESGGDLTSSLGNTFITVLVDNGSSIDVIGVGVNQFELADAQALAAPSGLTVTPVSNGLELSWSPVLEPDLAGYAIYYSDRSFISPYSAGVRRVGYLEGSTRHLLSGLSSRTWMAVTAVDFSGNESSPTTLVDGIPLAGAAPALELASDRPGGGVNDAIQLTASGAESYDWDLDGDGVFEVQADSSGQQQADTSSTGIIRPRVRANSGDAVALGGLSLLVSGNSAPYTSAVANPQSGSTPLEVTFTGEAEDAEDGTELTYAWDFDGDGIYEPDTDSASPDPFTYLAPGVFNARFRAEDSGGAWSTSSVVIIPTGMDLGKPHAEFSWQNGGFFKNQPGTLDASASLPSFGAGITKYEWDLDGDGLYEIDNGTDPVLPLTFDNAGDFTVGLRVTDSDGQVAGLQRELLVQGWRNIVLQFGGQITMYEQHMEIVNGKPAFAYGETIPGGVKSLKYGYVSGDYTTPEGWDFITLVEDETDPVGIDCDLEVIAGNPAITYLNLGNNDLRYIRSSTPGGYDPEDWSSSISIENDVQSPFSNNGLTEVDGRPAVIFKDSTGDNLYYSHSSTPEGTSASDWIDLLVANDNYNFAMLNLIDGHPAIVYTRDVGNPDNLTFMRSSTPTGDSAQDWNNKVLIDTGGIMGSYSQLETINGRPAIAYTKGNDDVCYAWSAMVDGSDEWLAHEIVPGPGFPSDLNALIQYRGRPALVYKDLNEDKLHFLHSSDPYGNGEDSWHGSQTVVPDESSGSSCSMVVYDGRLLMVHFTLHDGDRYMKLSILYEE